MGPLISGLVQNVPNMPIDPTTIDPSTVVPEWWPVLLLAAAYIGEKIMGFLKSRGVDLVKMAEQQDKVAVQQDQILERINELAAFLPALKQMRSEIRDLYDWHNVKDEDGVPRWYDSKRTVERGFEKVEERLNETIRLLDKLLRSTR